MKYFIFCFIIFLSFHAALNAQEVSFNYLPLKSKFDSKEEAITKIYTLANKKIKSDSKSSEKVMIWKFLVFDSLRIAENRNEILDSLNTSSKFLDEITKLRIRYLYALRLDDDPQMIQDAIKEFILCADQARKLGALDVEANCYRNIGAAYNRLDDFKKAITYLLKAFNYSVKQKDTNLMLGSSTTLANSYKNSKEFDNAQYYYDIALKLAMETNNLNMIAGNYNNLGSLAKQRGQNNEALKFYFKAAEMNIKSGNDLWLSFNYNNIGNVYSKMGNYGQAANYLIKSKELKEKLNDRESLRQTLLNLSEVYDKAKDYSKAYKYLKEFNQISDSLNFESQKRALDEYEAKYQNEKKELEIEKYKMSEEIQLEKNKSLELKVQRGFNIFLIFLFAGIILIGSIIILVRRNKNRSTTNKLLNSKNIEIQNTNFALTETLKELSEKNQEIIDSINYATYIQRASLPNISQQSSDVLNFELFFSPKDIVSGDFYFSYQQFNKSIFGVADCTGHGVPGAMVSLVGMNAIDKVVREEKHGDTSEMVNSLNMHVLESLHRGNELINDGMDISFCYLDHEKYILHFTGAHHDAYILRASQHTENISNAKGVEIKAQSETHTLFVLKGTRRPIGKWFTNSKFFEVQFDVQKGDRIILFSDGYADQMGGSASKKMKKGTMIEYIMQSADKTSNDQMAFLKQQFDHWQGTGEQIDDVCLLITEIIK